MTTDIALTSNEARQLTDRIKVAVEGTWLLIQDAYTSRAWAALGYDSWDTYCNAEFGATRLRLPREERQTVVASLRESGLSLRAISTATGISRPTVIRDIRASEVVNSSPPSQPTVVGMDGHIYGQSQRLAMASDEWVEPSGPEPATTLTGRHSMNNASGPKTIGPPLTDKRGRLMPQRAQRKAIADGLAALSGLCVGFARLDELDESINREEAEQWLLDLSTSLRVLRSLNAKLKEHLNGSQ